VGGDGRPLSIFLNVFESVSGMMLAGYYIIYPLDILYNINLFWSAKYHVYLGRRSGSSGLTAMALR